MSRLSWGLLLGAIAVATATVTILASFGPEWPDLFASCGGDEGVHEGGPPRAAAIADWKDWWNSVYWVGLAISSALAVGWAWAAHWRPRRRTVVALVVAVAAIAVALAISPVLAVVLVAIFAIGWSFVLGFPDYTFAIAPVLLLTTTGLSALAMNRLERGGQRIAQIVLAFLLVTAWVALGLTGFPAKGAFSC